MARERKPRSNTTALAAALQKMLRVKEGVTALLFEVRNAAGFSSNRSADAISMGLWPSRGLTLEGYEFKQSRNDFLSEIKDPSKAEAFAKYCDHWWLVVSSDDIVKPGELPKNWGMIGYNKNKTALEVKIDAPKLEPVPICRHFLAALLKAGSTPVSTADELALKAEYDKGKSWAESMLSSRARTAEESLAKLQKKVTDFQQASGISISDYWKSSADVGKIVREVLSGQHKRDEERIESIYHTAKNIISDIEKLKQVATAPQIKNEIEVEL